MCAYIARVFEVCLQACYDGISSPGLICQRVLKSQRVPLVLPSPPASSDSISGSSRAPERQTYHKGPLSHVITQLCAGNERERIFADMGGGRRRGEEGERETSDTKHVDEGGSPLLGRTPRGGRAARRRHEDDGRGTCGHAEGMINTRALFSDFLPRDPRAQIACK